MYVKQKLYTNSHVCLYNWYEHRVMCHLSEVQLTSGGALVLPLGLWTSLAVIITFYTWLTCTQLLVGWHTLPSGKSVAVLFSAINGTSSKTWYHHRTPLVLRLSLMVMPSTLTSNVMACLQPHPMVTLIEKMGTHVCSNMKYLTPFQEIFGEKVPFFAMKSRKF